MIETFSDSDWSGNKQHRRSTSCGVHTLNGGFLFASSRTQRVVSLSSCESELHSMVSALCDGIYLRRCIEFLTGCQVEHHLLVDSSSARQVAMRQGPGRLKHVSGKLLWIQQVVHEGKVQLTQVPTLWNVADAGTKPLASKRVQMLLHCIGMARAEGGQTIGQEEYEMQFSKYSSGKQINALAKNIARVIVFMGLEPLQGATAMPLGESDIYEANQCKIEPNHVQSEGYSWMFIMMCSVLVLAVLAFWGWIYKRANDAYTSFDHVYTQYAIMSSAVTILERKVAQMETDMRRLREGHTELSGEIEMVSDSAENTQWGLINMGGYTNFHGLTPFQRQQMYTLERANLIAARTMGMQRYLNVVRTQNQGIVHGGDDTDMDRDVREAGEEEQRENDPAVNPEDTPEITQVTMTFRNELNDCLRREQWSDAAVFQRGVMQALDLVNQYQPVPAELKQQLFYALAADLQVMSDRHAVTDANQSERYRQYVNQLREMAYNAT